MRVSLIIGVVACALFMVAGCGKKGGTGLGTYSAKLMIETMGGSIRLDCTAPGETTVVVSLPGVN